MLVTMSVASRNRLKGLYGLNGVQETGGGQKRPHRDCAKMCRTGPEILNQPVKKQAIRLTTNSLGNSALNNMPS